MAKLNIIGNLIGTSGYSVHTAKLAEALSKDHDVKLSVGLPQGWERMVNDQQLEMIRKPDSQDRINIIIDLPYTWIYHADKKNNIGFLVWEGDRIPASWIKCLLDERIKQVWVPSTHVRNAVLNTIQTRQRRDWKSMEYLITKGEWLTLEEKIRIVPHGVDLKIFQPEQKPEKFSFICNKGFRNLYDRGGIQYALKAFCSEFKQGEARLMVKLNPAYSVGQPAMQYMIQQMKLGETLKDVQFGAEQIPMDMMKRVYNAGHVFLSPTGGEAFNLPVLEAMACGLPVIATGFGGQMDYMNEDNGWFIDYDLKEVRNELLYEGIEWARVKMDHLRELMRYAYDNREEVEAKGKRALADAQAWTWEKSAEKASKCLAE